MQLEPELSHQPEPKLELHMNINLKKIQLGKLGDQVIWEFFHVSRKHGRRHR